MKKNLFFTGIFLLVIFSGCGYINEKPIPLGEKKGISEHTPFWNYEGWIIARGSIHNHTTFSDGCRTPEDLIQQARNEGLAVLSITDHREGRTCLDKDQKICVNMGGFDSKKVGSKKYFDYMKKLADETEWPVLLVGFEIGPYMWNEGYFPWLTLKATHWHFTVYKIDTPELFSKMPAPWGVLPQPQPDPGLKPYLDFVNYVIDNGGIVFQAHPESGNYERYYNLIYLLSGAPTHLTEKLLRLTGVAIVPSGLEEVAQPSGEWDRANAQYLVGIREKPLWGIGDADFHCPDPGESLRNGTTLFYLKNLTRDEVFNAMLSGKMVALMGEAFQEVFVSEFSVGDGKTGTDKIMLGEEVSLSTVPVIKFSLNREIPGQIISLIRNGKKIFQTRTSSFEFRDEKAGIKKVPVFYRVEVRSEDGKSWLFTNPIFVSWETIN